MPVIQVFDPAQCCSTGVCGTEPIRHSSRLLEAAGADRLAELVEASDVTA